MLGKTALCLVAVGGVCIAAPIILYIFNVDQGKDSPVALHGTSGSEYLEISNSISTLTNGCGYLYDPDTTNWVPIQLMGANGAQYLVFGSGGHGEDESYALDTDCGLVSSILLRGAPGSYSLEIGPIVSNVTMLSPHMTNNHMTFSFATQAGVNYQINASSNLYNYDPVAVMAGTGSNCTFTATSNPDTNCGFYLVSLALVRGTLSNDQVRLFPERTNSVPVWVPPGAVGLTNGGHPPHAPFP